MPVILLDRLELPNMRMYTLGSVIFVSACIYISTQVVRDPNWNANKSDSLTNSLQKEVDLNMTNGTVIDARTMGQYLSDVFIVMIREPICVWVSLLGC